MDGLTNCSDKLDSALNKVIPLPESKGPASHPSSELVEREVAATSLQTDSQLIGQMVQVRTGKRSCSKTILFSETETAITGTLVYRQHIRPAWSLVHSHSSRSQSHSSLDATAAA